MDTSSIQIDRSIETNTEEIAYPGFPYTSNFHQLDNGLNLHYLDEGEGEPIILLHGVPTSSYLWRDVIPELSTQGRVIVPDLINFGLSDKTEEPLNFVEHGELISELIADLELENVTIIGHDWGGPIGLIYALDNPNNIAGIAYFESPVVPLPNFAALEILGNGLFVDTFINPANSETNIIDNNLFIEGYLFNPQFGGVAESPTEAERAVYREPFLTLEDREQLLTFPLELPILDTTDHPVYDPDGEGGLPAEPVPNIEEFINFRNYLATTDTPQLLVVGDPGFTPPELILPLASQIPGLEIQTVGNESDPAFHFLPEDVPEQLGTLLGEWYDNSVVTANTEPDSTITLEITIESLAPENGVGIAQTWFGFHDGSFDLYNLGETASPQLETLAEDGIVGIEPLIPGLIDEAVAFGAIPTNFPTPEETVAGLFGASPAGVDGTQGIIFSDNRVPPFFLLQNPGETFSATVTIDRDNISNNRFFNYATMLFPTNDGFIANDDPQEIEIFDENGNFIGAEIIVTGEDVLDAGTEVNDEDPTNVLYTLDVIGNSVDENGTIQPFPGFLAAGEGGVLDFTIDGEAIFANADFTVPEYPIARISVNLVEETEIEPEVPETQTIDFDEDNLAAGTIISDQYAGIEFSTSNEFGLMLFDSDNVTGEDFDLGATGLGNILIISEDGNADNPDDNAAGGTIKVEFDELTYVNSLSFLDIDESGSAISAFGEDGNILETIEIPSLGDNSFQELPVDLADVSYLAIDMIGSGALTELTFS